MIVFLLIPLYLLLVWLDFLWTILLPVDFILLPMDFTLFLVDSSLLPVDSTSCELSQQLVSQHLSFLCLFTGHCHPSPSI